MISSYFAMFYWRKATHKSYQCSRERKLHKSMDTRKQETTGGVCSTNWKLGHIFIDSCSPLFESGPWGTITLLTSGAVPTHRPRDTSQVLQVGTGSIKGAISLSYATTRWRGVVVCHTKEICYSVIKGTGENKKIAEVQLSKEVLFTWKKQIA